MFAFVACKEEKAPITITLDPNLMYEAPQLIQAMSGDKITLPDANELWKVQDKIFCGWSTSSSGYPTYEAYSTFSSDTAVRLYAQWKNKVTYSLNEKGYYTVTSYTYSGEKTYSIPDTYQGLPVKDWRAFWGQDCQISELIIPASITYIISLPPSVRTVSVAAGNPVYKMDSNCLIEKRGEDNILIGATQNFSSFPDDITIIGYSAFKGSPITSISIPNGITEIGADCFANCENLKEISIPSSVTYIGGDAFENCPNLESIILPWHFGDSTVYDYSGSRFKDYTGTLILGEGWTKIESKAFQQSGISEIVLPSTLEEIGSFAFGYASNLEKVKIPSSVTTIGYQVFADNSNTIVIDCSEFASQPSGWKSNWNHGQTALFKNSVYDDNYVYSDESKSRVIALRDSSKGEYTFPNTVTTIDSYVFSNAKVEDLVIPEGIEILSYSSINNNLDLKSLSLPSTLKEIGGYAFAYCQYLSEVKYNGTKAKWETITKGTEWHKDSPFTKIICTDGEVTL